MNFDKTMVIVAHCDDEVLGAGGLIHNLSSHGSEVAVVVVSPRSINSRPGVEDGYAEKLMSQAESVAKVLGSRKPIFGKFRQEITSIKEEECMFKRWGNDLNFGTVMQGVWDDYIISTDREFSVDKLKISSS